MVKRVPVADVDEGGVRKDADLVTLDVGGHG